MYKQKILNATILNAKEENLTQTQSENNTIVTETVYDARYEIYDVYKYIFCSNGSFVYTHTEDGCEAMQKTAENFETFLEDYKDELAF